MQKEAYGSVYAQSSHESLPPYSTTYNPGDERNYDSEKENNIPTRIARTWTRLSTVTRIGPVISSAIESTTQFWTNHASPALRKVRFTKKQTYALLLLLLFGIIPFAAFGRYEAKGNVLFWYAFTAKIQSCENAIALNMPQNSTVEGAESLFVLDASFGGFTFAQAKAIDVAWDIIIGHGWQLCTWTVAYIVFSDAIVRLIERHPAPFRVFRRIGLEGPSLNSGWALLEELFKKKSKRTWGLFFCMLLSTVYVLSIPAFLGAMTGYDSQTIPWVTIGPDENNIVPASYFETGYAVVGTWNTTFSEPTCEASSQLSEWSNLESNKKSFCDCELPDGKRLAYYEWVQNISYAKYQKNPGSTYDDCHLNYTGNTQTYETFATGQSGARNCNETMDIKIGSTTYSAYSLNITTAYCWNNVGYNTNRIRDSARCLPDTANPSYQWGFSTMLVSIFLILQFGWAISMYIIWQDAQFNSELVKCGFRLTELGAAFVVTEAAKRKTDLLGQELIRRDVNTLKRELYQSTIEMGVVIEREILREEGFELRKRVVVDEKGIES